MPAWLIWLCPVPLATVGAIAWASWSTRTRRPAAAIDSVVEYEKFCLAMTTPVPGPRPRPGGEARDVRRPAAGAVR